MFLITLVESIKSKSVSIRNQSPKNWLPSKGKEMCHFTFHDSLLFLQHFIFLKCLSTNFLFCVFLKIWINKFLRNSMRKIIGELFNTCLVAPVDTDFLIYICINWFLGFFLFYESFLIIICFLPLFHLSISIIILY